MVNLSEREREKDELWCLRTEGERKDGKRDDRKNGERGRIGRRKRRKKDEGKRNVFKNFFPFE